jgi:hypothetical protein
MTSRSLTFQQGQVVYTNLPCEIAYNALENLKNGDKLKSDEVSLLIANGKFSRANIDANNALNGNMTEQEGRKYTQRADETRYILPFPRRPQQPFLLLLSESLQNLLKINQRSWWNLPRSCILSTEWQLNSNKPIGCRGYYQWAIKYTDKPNKSS